jgi:lycopene cyclase domain-containing protein
MWNERYLYLALDLGSFLFPFAFSFFPKANFSKEWKFIIPSLLITTLVFVLWDEAFTRMGVWGFTSRYLTGIYLGNLPLEEVLFFLFIPYSCMFIYFSANHLAKKDYLAHYSRTISISLIVLLVVIGSLHANRWYTSVTVFSLAGFLAAHVWILKSTYMGRFYFSYLFVLIPFFLVNSVLTGSWIDEQVVWYNNAENMGIRIGTIPADDLFYNMLMLLLVTTLYEYFKKRGITQRVWFPG